MRDRSLKRRQHPVLKNIVISMGGSDPSNASTKILNGLQACHLPENCHVSIIMSSHSPHIPSVRDQMINVPWTTNIYFDVQNMAEILVSQDLAIGAVGVSAWERCCLGIPSISIAVAQNQIPGAKAFHRSRGSIVIDQEFSNEHNLASAINYFSKSMNLTKSSKICSSLVDGYGVSRVLERIQ